MFYKISDLPEIIFPIENNVVPTTEDCDSLRKRSPFSKVVQYAAFASSLLNSNDNVFQNKSSCTKYSGKPTKRSKAKKKVRKNKEKGRRK